MGVKQWVRAMLVLSALPSSALALGLGDIRLNSPLNAPLDAEIELVNATPEELASLRVQLASRETFARYGLEWPAFLSSVTLAKAKGDAGRDVLRVRSTEVDHRALPDAAGRCQLGARPPGARVHAAARSAGLRADAGAGAGRARRRPPRPRAAAPWRARRPPDAASGPVGRAGCRACGATATTAPIRSVAATRSPASPARWPPAAAPRPSRPWSACTAPTRRPSTAP